MIQDSFKIRASSAYNFLSLPKLKRDRDAGLLSQTARNICDSYIIKNRYNYTDDLETNALLKGTINEEQSISLVDILFPLEGINRIKNKERKETKYLSGEPDLVLPDKIEEIKSVWDVKSLYSKKNISKVYHTQVQVYMHLFGKEKATLYYCLTEMPREMLLDEIFRLEKYHSDLSQYSIEEKTERFIENHRVQNVPLRERVRKFDVEYDPEVIQRLEEAHGRAVNYIANEINFLDGL